MQKIYELLKTHLIVVGAVVIVLCIIQIGAIVSAWYLAKQLKSGMVA